MFSLELSITCAFFFATIWFKSSTTNKWYKYELPAPQFKTQTCHQCSIPELFSIFQNHISFNFRLILVYIYIFNHIPQISLWGPSPSPCWSASAAKICCRGSWVPWTPATSGASPGAARSCAERPRGRRVCWRWRRAARCRGMNWNRCTSIVWRCITMNIVRL